MYAQDNGERKTMTEHTITINNINNPGGIFHCPNCNSTISPEDETETVYSIISEKVEENSLKELKLKCKCGTLIKLILNGEEK